jgi:hypothetical protein
MHTSRLASCSHVRFFTFLVRFAVSSPPSRFVLVPVLFLCALYTFPILPLLLLASFPLSSFLPPSPRPLDYTRMSVRLHALDWTLSSVHYTPPFPPSIVPSNTPSIRLSCSTPPPSLYLTGTSPSPPSAASAPLGPWPGPPTPPPDPPPTAPRAGSHRSRHHHDDDHHHPLALPPPPPPPPPAPAPECVPAGGPPRPCLCHPMCVCVVCVVLCVCESVCVVCVEIMRPKRKPSSSARHSKAFRN